jgi:peptidoglycan/LPS O-acetylase OafA/YrhL
VAATKLPYVPHLDGLRGIAIAGVLLQHFDPTGHISRIDVGLIGVVLFFVWVFVESSG